MKVCRTVDYEDMVTVLRGEALNKWLSATEDQREVVWSLINDLLANDGKIPTESEVNDYVWFQCEDVFYPEDDPRSDEDDDFCYDEDDYDDVIEVDTNDDIPF